MLCEFTGNYRKPSEVVETHLCAFASDYNGRFGLVEEKTLRVVRRRKFVVAVYQPQNELHRLGAQWGVGEFCRAIFNTFSPSYNPHSHTLNHTSTPTEISTHDVDVHTINHVFHTGGG